MSYRLILTLFLLVGISCQKMTNSTIIDEIELSSVNNMNTLLCFSSSNKGLRGQFPHEYYPRKVLCDPYNVNNRFIYYCSELAIGDKIILALQDGRIIHIDPLDKSKTIIADLETINWRVKVNMALQKRDPGIIPQLSIPGIDTFYDYYLLSRLSSLLNDTEKESHYLSIAKTKFEEDPSPIYLPLYYEINSIIKTELIMTPIELLEPIDLGRVTQGDKVKHDCIFMNYSNEDLFIFQSSSSCKCLSVKCNYRVPSNTTGNIHLEYDTSGLEKGSYEKSIILITNTKQQTITIKVRIEII